MHTFALVVLIIGLAVLVFGAFMYRSGNNPGQEAESAGMEFGCGAILMIAGGVVALIGLIVRAFS